jgi:hypothetical protein
MKIAISCRNPHYWLWIPRMAKAVALHKKNAQRIENVLSLCVFLGFYDIWHSISLYYFAPGLKTGKKYERNTKFANNEQINFGFNGPTVYSDIYDRDGFK